jgi:hypothetical protein
MDRSMQVTYPRPSSRFIVLAMLASAVAGGSALADEPVLDAPQRETLLRYARDTWRSFEAMAGPGLLPADALEKRESGDWQASIKTTPTDIGAYLWSTLAAARLKIIDDSEADRRIDGILERLERLPRVHGFFFDRIDPRTGATLEVHPRTGVRFQPWLSVVDNAWLATALMMVRNTRPPMRRRAEELLRPMDFRFFYEPYDPADPAKHPGQFHDVYHPDDHSFGTLNALLNTEQRIASYIAIARGEVPADHYFRINRTWPPGKGPAGQQQVPEGVWRTYRDVEVFEGHYTYRGMRIVPSWGGSMFEALMVPLFVPESRWGPRSWGTNHPLYVRAQIEHGLEEARYGFWGFSPATQPSGSYRNYGVSALGVNPEGYTSNDRNIPAGAAKSSGEFTGGVVTPHASFLALRFFPREAMANLQSLREHFPIYGRYGFMDSVNLTTRVVSDRLLSLDQGMIMASIANALCDEAMQHAFSDGEVETAIRPLIAIEEFTARARGEPVAR